MKSRSTSPRFIWVSIYVNRQPTPLILDICFRQIDVWFSWTTSSVFINYIVDHYSLTIASPFTESTSAGQLATYRLFRATTQMDDVKILFIATCLSKPDGVIHGNVFHISECPQQRTKWSCFISFCLASTSCWTNSPVANNIKHCGGYVIMIVTMPDWRREFNT